MVNSIVPTQHSQDLRWLLTRKSSAYIVKQHGLPRTFSREPGNLTAQHSYTVSMGIGCRDRGGDYTRVAMVNLIDS